MTPTWITLPTTRARLNLGVVSLVEPAELDGYPRLHLRGPTGEIVAEVSDELDMAAVLKATE